MGDTSPNQNSNSYYRNPTFYHLGPLDLCFKPETLNLKSTTLYPVLRPTRLSHGHNQHAYFVAKVRLSTDSLREIKPIAMWTRVRLFCYGGREALRDTAGDHICSPAGVHGFSSSASLAVTTRRQGTPPPSNGIGNYSGHYITLSVRRRSTCLFTGAALQVVQLHLRFRLICPEPHLL